MRIAIIGAGLPALIVARELTDQGAHVDVFGKPAEAGVLSGLGPRHLWATWSTESLGPVHQVAVRWHRAAGEAYAIQPSMEDLGGLSAKVGKHYTREHRPCRGVTEFPVVANGFDLLTSRLRIGELNIVAQFVEAITGAREIVLDGANFGRYNAIATTLAPSLFRRLYKGEWAATPPELQAVGFDTHPYSPAGVHFSESDSDMVVYSGDSQVPWYRASSVYGGWCYEYGLGAARFPSIKVVRTQMIGKWDAAYPAGIVPIGRFAEWDSELMVDSVYEDRSIYAHRLYKEAVSA